MLIVLYVIYWKEQKLWQLGAYTRLYRICACRIFVSMIYVRKGTESIGILIAMFRFMRLDVSGAYI